MVVAQEEDDFVDMVLVGDGRTECAHDAVGVLDKIAVDDAFDQILFVLGLHPPIITYNCQLRMLINYKTTHTK